MKKLNKNIHRIIAGAAAVVFSLLSPLSNLPDALAASGSILDTAIIPNADEKMDAEYEFIAKFIDGVTEVEPFGSGWRVQEWQPGAADKLYWTLIPSAAQKGGIGVRYKNIGSYNGTTLDLKITVNDWEEYVNSVGNIGYSQYEIGHCTQGYNYVDQTWEFVETGTDSLVEISGYMSICDVDVFQYVQFSSVTANAINNLYVSGSTNKLKYKNVGEELRFYSDFGENLNANDVDGWFTFTYKEQSSLRFKWGIDFDTRQYNKNKVYNKDCAGGNGNGDYFFFSAKKPLATSTALPYKQVSDSDESSDVSNTLSNRNEEFIYTITHFVPDEWNDFYYKDYTFGDRLEECLEVQEVKITNLSNADVTDWFDIAAEENSITASVKQSVLESGMFYYDTYTYEIKVKVKEDADLTDYREGDKFILRNTASVSVDGDSALSNEVETYIEAKINPEPKITKKIVVGQELAEEYKVIENGEKITFYGTVEIPNTKRYSPVQVIDELHHAFTYQGITVKDSAENDITSWGSAALNENTLIFTFQEEYLTKLIGTDISFYLDTTINTDAHLSDIQDGRIPNTYKLRLDGDTYDSNVVHVTVDTKDNQISKSIEVNGVSETAYQLEDNTQDIIFRGDVQITNKEKLKSVMLSDELHPALTFKDLKVVDSAGKDITSQGKIKTKGQLVQFSFDPPFIQPLTGQAICWRLTVNYTEGSDLSSLEEYKIPNIMTLWVNDDEKQSNQVTVTPITYENSIVKRIKDTSGSLVTNYSLKNNKDVISFHGSANISNKKSTDKIILRDALPRSLAADKASVKVFTASGEEITKAGKVKLSKDNVLTFTIGGEMAQKLAGKQLIWEFDARYDQTLDFTKDQSATNTMDMDVNGERVSSNEVDVHSVINTAGKATQASAVKTSDDTQTGMLLAIAGAALLTGLFIYNKKKAK